MNLHDKNKLKSTVLELNRFSIDNAINHDPGISIEEYILTQRFHQLTEIEEYKYLYRLSNGFTDTNKILQDISYLSFIYGIEWEQPFITEVEERIKNVLNQGLRSDIIYNPTKLTITWEDFSYIEKEFILAWAMYRDETGKDTKEGLMQLNKLFNIYKDFKDEIELKHWLPYIYCVNVGFEDESINVIDAQHIELPHIFYNVWSFFRVCDEVINIPDPDVMYIQKNEVRKTYPKEFDTIEAKELFSKLEDAGYITKTGEVYNWEKSNSLFAYFCLMSSNYLNLRDYSNRIPWAKLYLKVFFKNGEVFKIEQLKSDASKFKEGNAGEPEGFEIIKKLCPK